MRWLRTASLAGGYEALHLAVAAAVDCLGFALPSHNTIVGPIGFGFISLFFLSLPYYQPITLMAIGPEHSESLRLLSLLLASASLETSIYVPTTRILLWIGPPTELQNRFLPKLVKNFSSIKSTIRLCCLGRRIE